MVRNFLQQSCTAWLVLQVCWMEFFLFSFSYVQTFCKKWIEKTYVLLRHTDRYCQMCLTSGKNDQPTAPGRPVSPILPFWPGSPWAPVEKF